jgi:N-acetyltransferase
MRSVVQPITIEGAFVRLEPLTLAHAKGLAEAATGPRETYTFTWVPDGYYEAREYIAERLHEQAEGSALPFATVDRRGGSVVGATRFMRIEYRDWPPGNSNQRGPEYPDAVEIGGTWLAAEAQRTAINTEAKLLMLSHAFEVFRVHRVNLTTDARNQRSRKAIERLGCRFDGVLRAYKPGSDGSIRDTAWFSMLESEWPAAKAALLARLGERRVPR